MGILDPKIDATVNPMPARVDETVGQGARSASKALDFLGGILGQLGRREGGGTKADAQLPLQQQWAQDSMTISQLYAAGDTEKARELSRQMQVNATRAGMVIRDQDKDVFLAATGEQLDTALEDPEARTRREFFESKEGQSAVFVARSQLGSGASTSDVEDAALLIGKQNATNMQVLNNDKTKWLHGGREAVFGVVNSQINESIAVFGQRQKAGERLSATEIEQSKALWEQSKARITAKWSERAGDEWSDVEAKFKAVDDAYAVMEGLAGSEQIKQEYVEAFVFAAEKSYKNGEITAGQLMIANELATNMSKFPEMALEQFGGLKEGMGHILQAMTVVPGVTATDIAGETDPVTNTNVTYTKTSDGGVTVSGGVWGDRTAMDERLNGKTSKHILSEASAGIELVKSGDKNKLGEPVYRDRTAQVLSDAYYRMTNVGRKEFVSAGMIDQLFGGGSVSTIKAIGKHDPEVARTLSAQAQTALQTQSAHVTQQLQTLVSQTPGLALEDGRVVANRESLLKLGIPLQAVVNLETAADEYYGGDIRAMIDDGALKLDKGSIAYSQARASALASIAGVSDSVNTLVDSRKALDTKSAEFGRMLSGYVNGEQVKEPEVTVGDTDAALDWSSIAAGGAATRADSFTKLEPEFARGIHQMVQDAKAEGVNLSVVSAYRSPEVQAGILANNMMRKERGGFSAQQKQSWLAAVEKYGPVEARKATYQGRTWEDWFTNTPNGNSIRAWIALPGSSQHQKGRAVDFGTEAGGLVRQGSKEAIWLKQNAAKYGVHIPLGNEPWQAEPVGSRDGSMEDKTASVSNNKIGDSLGIDFAAYERDAGLPEGYLEAMAMIESSGNPGARRPGSQYIGLFQLGDAVREEYGVKDPLDPEQNTKGAVAFAKANMKGLRNVLGRDPTGPELYLAHQQGLGGATALLKNPDLPAVDALATIMDRATAEKHVLSNAGNLNMTSSEFADIWVRKFQERGQFAGSGQANADGPSSGGDIAIPRTTQLLMDAGANLDGMGVIADDTEVDQSNREAAVDAGIDTGLSEEADAAEAVEAAAEAEATAEKDKAVAEQQEAQALTRIKDIGGLTKLSRSDRSMLVRAAGSAQAASEAIMFESMDEADEAIANGQVPEGAVVFVQNEGVFINGE